MARPRRPKTTLAVNRLEDRLTPAFVAQPSFNRDSGFALQHFGTMGGSDQAYAVIVDSSARIVMAGIADATASTGGSTRVMGLLRLNPDGTPDTTFGPNGTGRMVIDPVGFSTSGIETGRSSVNSILEFNGGYLLAGTAFRQGDDDICIVQINYDGTFNTNFANDGVLFKHVSGTDRGYDLIQVAEGTFDVGNRFAVSATVGANNKGLNGDFGVFQFDGAGNPVTTFGDQGVARYDFGGGLSSTDKPFGITLLPGTSTLVVGGQAQQADGTDGVGVIRLTAAGALDPTFDGDGVAFYPSFGAIISDATVLGDGSTVAVGSVPNPLDPNLGQDALVVKLRPDGTFDPSFGFGGILTVELGSNNDDFDSVVATGDGGFVCVGRAQAIAEGRSDYDAVAMRFTPVGLPDFLFGNKGIVKVDFNREHNEPHAAVVDGAGRVIIVGETMYLGDADFFAFRLEQESTTNVDSDGDGLLDIWETMGKGVDVNNDGVIELDLYALGARPNHMDLFLEIDSMQLRGGPVATAIATMRTAFASAPVLNLDGRPGINLIATNDDNTIPFANWTNPVNGFPPQFDAAKAAFFGTQAQRNDPNWVNIRAALSLVTRYCVVANFYGTTRSTGIARGIPAQDFIVTLGTTYTTSPGSGPTANQVVGTLMHEFGHTLGLFHGGTRNGPNYNVNYVSVMNYRHQFGLDLTNFANTANSDVLMPGFPSYAGPGSTVINDWANVIYGWRAGGPGAAGAEKFDPEADHEDDIFANNPEAYAPRTVLAPGPGAPPVIRVLRGDTGEELNSFPAFDPSFTGGVRTARADVTGDGVPDVIAGTGPGAPTLVRIFDGLTGQLVTQIAPFEASFTGGVFVSAADFDRDGFADVVITPDQGGGPRVRVLRADGTTINDFFGIEDPNFRGGARAAVGDVNGDGVVDLLVSAGFGGGPRVATFDGRTIANPVAGNQLPPKLYGDYFAFEDSLRNGVFLASGDVDGDGIGDVIYGAGPGGGPRVTVASGARLLQSTTLGVAQSIANFFAGDPNSRSGVHVGTTNADDVGGIDVVTGAAPGSAPRLVTYTAAGILGNGSPTPFRDELVFDPSILSGVFVG